MHHEKTVTIRANFLAPGRVRIAETPPFSFGTMTAAEISLNEARKWIANPFPFMRVLGMLGMR